ncbi:cytochrome b5-like [Neodiprion fabricii]|uniref:cytochrome b5-like n=1 Tax=Neodiprion fabricii TaxID=2872261 RepID=UPI001ED8D349|nr:cytochrome b5-like [Neodiprion fabricii]
MAGNGVFTLKEVNDHRGRESCWIVVDGKVYDVTKYLDQHPGGDEEILNESGTDATKPFAEVGHSSDAKEILGTLLIGHLHRDDVKASAWKNYSVPWSRIAVVAAVPVAAILVASFVHFNRK